MLRHETSKCPRTAVVAMNRVAMAHHGLVLSQNEEHSLQEGFEIPPRPLGINFRIKM